MDSITHALYKAVAAEDADPRKQQPFGDPIVGLQPMALRPLTHSLFVEAEGTDLHVILNRGPELLALQLEFINGGLCPPAGLALAGADVIISPGQIDIHATTDDGERTWVATLAKDATARHYTRSVGWTERVL